MFDRSTTILGPYFQREYISNKLAFTAEQKDILMKKLIEMPCTMFHRTIYFNALTFLNCIKAAQRNRIQLVHHVVR